MKTIDIIDDSFPHGTPRGYADGCRSAACPAVISCRDVHRRYSGDWGFRKLVDAGLSLEEILAKEAADKAAARERARAAAARARGARRPPGTSPEAASSPHRCRGGRIASAAPARHLRRPRPWMRLSRVHRSRQAVPPRVDREPSAAADSARAPRHRVRVPARLQGPREMPRGDLLLGCVPRRGAATSARSRDL